MELLRRLEQPDILLELYNMRQTIYKETYSSINSSPQRIWLIEKNLNNTIIMIVPYVGKAVSNFMMTKALKTNALTHGDITTCTFLILKIYLSLSDNSSSSESELPPSSCLLFSTSPNMDSIIVSRSV